MVITSDIGLKEEISKLCDESYCQGRKDTIEIIELAFNEMFSKTGLAKLTHEQIRELLKSLYKITA